jgi:hypothetical protein
LRGRPASGSLSLHITPYPQKACHASPLTKDGAFALALHNRAGVRLCKAEEGATPHCKGPAAFARAGSVCRQKLLPARAAAFACARVGWEAQVLMPACPCHRRAIGAALFMQTLRVRGGGGRPRHLHQPAVQRRAAARQQPRLRHALAFLAQMAALGMGGLSPCVRTSRACGPVVRRWLDAVNRQQRAARHHRQSRRVGRLHAPPGPGEVSRCGRSSSTPRTRLLFGWRGHKQPRFRGATGARASAPGSIGRCACSQAMFCGVAVTGA